MNDNNDVDLESGVFLDPDVGHAFLNLLREIESANISPDRKTFRINMIVEVDGTEIILSDRESDNSPSGFANDHCSRQGKTAKEVEIGGRIITICCPGHPKC